MKKLLALTMVASMVMVAACGGTNGNSGTTPTNTPAETNNASGTGNGNTNTGEETIEGLQPEEGATLLVWESKEERPFVEAIAKEFEEKYGVKIKFEEVGAGDQVNKLISDG